MQKQIIVPFATAIIAQTAHAMCLQDNLNQTPNLLAQAGDTTVTKFALQTNDQAECEAKYNALYQKKIKRCQDKNKGQKCFDNAERWYKNQVINNCLPCDQKAMAIHQRRYQACNGQKNEQKCREKHDRWLANQLEKCNPSCEGIAKKKRLAAIKNCKQTFKRGKERTQCINDVNEAFSAEVEMCNCYEAQEAELAGRFEWCNAMQDPKEKEECLASINEILEQMKEENCHEQPEPDCWENAVSHYEEILAICDALDDTSPDKQQCYEQANEKFDAMNQECCAEDAHTVHKEKAERCDEIDDPEKREVCHAQVKESLEQALEECRPEPPTCWEKAEHYYHDLVGECETIVDDDQQRGECFENARKELELISGDCCIEDAVAHHKEKAEGCDEIEDPEKREVCHAQVKESLEQAIEECRPEPPTCWDEAMNWLNGHLKECNAIDDPEEMQKCHAKGHAKYEKWVDECEIQECYEAWEAEMGPKFEACKEFDTVAQQEACKAEVAATLKQLQEENCHEQPNCWENAASRYEEILATCDALDDMSADKQQCYEQANEKFDAMNHECCVEDAHVIHKEEAERCEQIEDPEQREICHAQVKESLEQALEMCRPQPPTCWDEAMNWLNTHLETCNAIEDPEEMQKCHSEGHAKFEEWAEECRIQECYDGLDAEFAPKFEACKEFDTVAQQEACKAEVAATLKQLKEENCHFEPDCRDQARALYDQSRAVCDAMTDQNEKEICYNEAERVYEEWTGECEIRECHEKAHKIHAPMFEECNAMTDPDEAQICHAEIDASLMKMLEDCYPPPPLTCYEEADVWVEERLAQCHDHSDQVEIDICQKEAWEEHAKWTEQCRLDECYDNAHTEHEPWYAKCSQVTDLVQQEECFKEARMSEQKMRDECHPQPPTCYDEAIHWYEEAMQGCTTDSTVDPSSCQKEVEQHYQSLMEGCRVDECVEGVHAQFKPEYEHCQTLTTEVERQACEQNVDQLVEEALEMCYPQPPTCYEEAEIWFAEKLAQCNDHSDQNEIDICMKEANERYTYWINECEMADCKERIRTELEPRFEQCYSLSPAKQQRCLDVVNADLEQMVQEQCYPAPPTCHEQADAYLEEALAQCEPTEDTYNDCVQLAHEEHSRWIEQCDITECVEKTQAEFEQRENECHAIDDLEEKDECLTQAKNWLADTIETCYPPLPTCWERADSLFQEEQAHCLTFSDDPVKIDACMKEAKGIYESLLEECEMMECVDRAYADHEPMFQECEMMDASEREECYRSVDESLEKQLQECYPAPPTCHEQADAYLEEALAECGTTTIAGTVDDCSEKAYEKHAAWTEECNVADCIERAHADHEPLFQECETLPAAQKDACIRSVTESLEKQTEECYPTPPTCYEEAREWYEGERNRCEATFATPTDCLDEAEGTYREMITDCEIAECQKMAHETAEAEFDCSSALVDPEICEAEKRELLDQLLARCEPQVPQVETACGFVDVDNRLDGFNAIQLDYHNAQRARHNASALAYNHTIAEGAQKYAEWMRDNDKFEHSDRDDRDGQGENLYMGSYSDISTTWRSSKKWYDEEPDYNYENPGDSTGVVGHFTQMVWKNTCQIGCGEADGYVVCRYAPAGNWRDWDGGFSQYVTNVQRPPAVK